MRDKFVGWCCEQLTGPPAIDDHGVKKLKKGTKPLARYSCGVLFPVIPGESGEEESEDEATDDEGREVENSAIKRRFVPPSSMGFSFFVSGEKVQLEFSTTAARYDIEDREESGQSKGGQLKPWKSTHQLLALTDAESDELLIDSPNKVERGHAIPPIEVFRQAQPGSTARACIDVRWRRHPGGWLVTATLCNQQMLEEEGSDFIASEKERNEKTLFEASLKCKVIKGTVGDYPRVDHTLLTMEEREIEVQYRHKKIYAVGHGVAVDWKVEDGSIPEFSTEALPRVEVPALNTEARNGLDCYEIAFLAKLGNGEGDDPEIIASLKQFVDDYEKWVNLRDEEAGQVGDDEAASQIVDRMKVAIERMRDGLKWLERDNGCATAFGIANRVMANQMKQGGFSNPAWRPFQLAFMLTTIESVVDDDSDSRDLVDLIWFPTGGGKTEAYLGLISFLIAWRRRMNPSSGGGTAIIMRYTLRLLTTQQFERATKMVCAMELLRRNEPDLQLGNEPISIGLWVGEASSPNRIKDACELQDHAKASDDKAPSKFVITKCPWCGEGFKASQNYRIADKFFSIVCLHNDCDYGGSADPTLPIQVVDEALYQNPPTFLIGTIDKFARMPWKEDTGNFFGMDGNIPPEMIIQDELHLISGALGSIAGLYEAGLDSTLISLGARPKYIASTATIRMAKDQVQRLYGRDLAVFPPPGLSSSDSYFARDVPVEEKSGRLYVGYFAPLLRRQECLTPLAAALLVAPECELNKEWWDKWWTLLVYHGSLKGVGASHTLMDTDVDERIKLMRKELSEIYKHESNDEQPKEWTRKRLEIKQLTSQNTADENVEIFSNLEKEYGEESVIDVALATSMVSVGLDVKRLALMVINGQPLTTAEYIQSSSRVGRSDTPGIVFANYYRGQARSLSHYENFRSYHESFYRFVEPSSVTPFTKQAMKRALHAALVVAVRFGAKEMSDDKCAGKFSIEERSIKQVIKGFKLRLKQASGEWYGSVELEVDKLVKEWQKQAEKAQKENRQLVYSGRGDTKNYDKLLWAHGDHDKGTWETLNSMRNVEDNAQVKPLIKRKEDHVS